MPSIFYFPRPQAFDLNGAVEPGAKLYFYAAGTSTDKAVYSDIDLTTPHTQPVVADSSGFFDTIYMDGNYKVILADADGVQTWSQDDVDSQSSFINGAQTWTITVDGSGNLNVYNDTDSENGIVLAPNGAVTVYHNGAARIASSSAGATVTGTLNATTDVTINGTSAVPESRTLTGSEGITAIGSLAANRTVQMDVNGMTEQTAITSGDFLPYYDTTAGAHRKVDYDDLFNSSAGNVLLGAVRLQWGNEASMIDGDVTVTFATAFSAAPVVVATPEVTDFASTLVTGVNSQGTASFKFNSNFASTTGLAGFDWYAIGLA